MKKHTANLLGRFRKSVTRNFAARSGVTSRRTTKLAAELLEDRALLAASFFAPAEPSGSLSVQLVPLANVAAGTQEIVTFGVPFTRGSVSQSQLSQIRVLKNGAEVPAFVEQLTPWRSIDDAGIDGQSVRVARIQIPYTFTSLNPEAITVQWGGPARTLNRTTMQDPRLDWHTVTSGTFVAADNVEEPDVLPVLPAAYLAKGMLDARTDPANSGVAETRDDPAAMNSRTFTGYTEYDFAEKNFFYTIINQNPGITVPYKTDPEPWLYDRSSGMYELYLRSGFATALREAVRAADFYADHLDASGFFTLKPGDPKYSYNESLAYTYWLLGDNRMLAPISTVVNAFNGTATHWTPNLSFFTERNVGDKLLATEVAYEVTGNATFKANLQVIVNDLIWHQNGAGGQLPGNRIDGGLYHTGAQHDISEASSGSVLIASSWMSALLVDPMVRAYGVWQNSQIADFVVRMGNFEKAASKTDANGQFGGTRRYPDYLMRTDGTSDNRSDTDVQHAMDVGAVAAWATYFAELRGMPDASLRQLANDLYATHDVGVNYWTRPGGTNFNVSPPRRYTWEYKNSPSFSWTLTGTDAPGQPGTLTFNATNYSVNENQGTATITVPRTGGSTGKVTVNYATSDGTANAGSDYTSSSGTLTFVDGETSKTFTVPIIDDTSVENAETVTLTLSNPTGGAALGSPASATLTITSDDTSNQPITVTLQQGVNGYSSTTDASVSTQYAQYTGGNGTTSIDGTQLGVYQLTGTNGYAVEGLIRFGDLGITTNATVSSATLTLSVDSGTANPIIRGYYLLAPWTTTPGSDLGWLHRGTGQDWASPGALGQGTDVVAGKSFVLPGITGAGTQMIAVNLDPAVVQSWIANPSANQGILLVNETTGAVVRVNASENATAAVRPKLSVTYTVGATTPQPGTLQFSNASYAVNENGGAATITVTRTNGSSGSVTVNYTTSNGTATAGSDYTAASGTLTLVAGETSKTFTVPITNDTAFEGNETVTLTLNNPTGGATRGSQTTAVLTIQDDDVAGQPGAFQFNAGSYSLTENGGALTVTVTRTGGTSGPVSVQYATGNGTATAGSDYTAASGTLTFADGEASKTFSITMLDDTLVEGNETVTLALSNPTGGATLGNPASVVFTILDNDSSTSVVLPTGFTQSVAATGLSSGTALAAAPDGRLFVLEQGGNARVIKNGALLATPAFTVTTVAEQERGLLGITFDPNFATNQLVYVYYTVGGPSPSPAHNRVSRFTLNGDVAVPGSEVVLIDLPDVTNRIHNGGALKFGSDGKLYIAVGNDGGYFNSPDLTKPFGKILRVNADGTIPTDNPFYNQTTGVNRAIWAIGLRNPYTFDVQPGTGLMYINDVGEAAWEEINQGAAGANYGWPNSEGYTTNPQYTSPVYAYGHGTGPHQGFAIVGAAFYNPAASTFPAQYAGKYFFMDYVNGWIEYVDPTAANPKTPTIFATNIPVRYDGGPVDLEVGADGALYYLNRLGGGVFKIQFSGSTQAPSITQHPGSQTATLGQPVTFSVAASSTLPVTYQWQKMDSGTTTWVDISGATSASYSITTTAAADNGDQFRCVVGNSVGNTNSNAATLTVTTNTAPTPTITTPTAGTLYNAGNTISFSGSATDSEQGPLPASSLSWWIVFHHDTHTHPFLGSEASAYATGASGSFTIPTSGEVAANQWYRVYLKATDAGGLSAIVFRDVNPRVSTFTLATNIAGLSLTLDGQPVAAGTATQGVVGMVRTLGAPSGQVVGGKTYNFVSWSDGGAQTHSIGTPASNTTYTATFQEATAPVGKFTNVTASSGVGAIITQRNQEAPNWWLTGQHLVDLDNDGDLDLFLDSHGGGSAIAALNDGHGVFNRVTSGTIPDTEIYQMYDINGDGKVDLATTYQDGGARWWINNSTPGNLNFTATSVTRGGNTSRAQVMIDFNGDGKVDWLRSEQPGLVIDYGNGLGGFTAGSLSFPIAGTTTNNNANFLPGDLDDDGDIDLLILTGGGYDGTLGKTAYWRNNGNLTFTDITASVGLPADGTVAKGVGDFDQDGDIDIIATENKAMPPVAYMNNGQGVFTKKAGAISGVAAGTLEYAAWGTAVTTDFDNDGITDIIMDGKYYLKVLRGTGGGNFTYMNTAWGIKDTAASAVDDGLCFGDIDRDGDLDIVGYNETYPTRTLNVYRNDLAPQSWLNIRPVGLAGNNGAAGAKISIYAAGTNQLLWCEQVAQYDFQVATSYYGYGETERHFGLGNRTNVDVVVEFPGLGHVTRINTIAANQTIRVLESAVILPTVAVNDGSPQRSRVTQLTVAFPGQVTLPANPAAAFRLTRLGPGGPVGDVTLAVDLSGSTATQTIARLTFSGALTEFGSLSDGNFTLTILGSQVMFNGAPLDGDGDGTPRGDNVTSLHRLYGDLNGDRFVNGADFALFRTAFGTVLGDPDFNAALDVNGDGVINGADFAEFRTRFGAGL